MIEKGLIERQAAALGWFSKNWPQVFGPDEVMDEVEGLIALGLLQSEWEFGPASLTEAGLRAVQKTGECN